MIVNVTVVVELHLLGRAAAMLALVDVAQQVIGHLFVHHAHLASGCAGHDGASGAAAADVRVTATRCRRWRRDFR